jgi:hypothetical protein
MAQCQKCKEEIKETMTDPAPTIFNKDGKDFTKWHATFIKTCDCGSYSDIHEVPPPIHD